jgi:hypothetical protein
MYKKYTSELRADELDISRLLGNKDSQKCMGLHKIQKKKIKIKKTFDLNLNLKLKLKN